MSALGAEQGDNPLRDAEKHIESSGLDWTFVRPSWFMQNYSTINADSIRQQGAFFEPAEGARTGFVDARDIAVAVAALTEEGHAGQAYAVTGPQALDRDQVARSISEATGKDVKYVPINDEQLEQGMRQGGAPESYVQLMTGLYGAVRAGHTARVSDDVRRVTGKDPIPFDQFARNYAEVWK